ncbi:MAG: DMT family transporter, partial [Ferruginibacter sp.]|nr:DMT family transporter [Ferruginibacter sp.]
MKKSTTISKNKSTGYFSLFITSTVWGTTWVASKFALQQKIPAIQLAYVRQFLAGLCFVGFFFFIKKLPIPNKKQWRWIVIMSMLMFVFANWLSTWGISYISSGFASLI